MSKIFQLLISVIILISVMPETNAQQGNVSAGGEATGTGGSLSYTIGQVDYLTYSSAAGSISFGLQQVWMTCIPELYEIPDLIIGDSEYMCFNATGTVIVAGSGKQFIVLHGGYAEIIAGQKIILKQGTLVEYGGMLHARIDDVYCEQVQSLLASISIEDTPAMPEIETTLNESFFEVYPNPTAGLFTLELLNHTESSNIYIAIYNMHGSMVLSAELPAQAQYNFNLTGCQPGIYLIRVIKGNEVKEKKLIKNQI